MRTIAIALLALALLPLPAVAGQPDGPRCKVATLESAHFDVSIVRAGSTVIPVAGEAVCPRDRIRTGSKGVAVIGFRDGTRITVGHDSEFVIERWQQRRLRANDASFELVRGAFRAVTGAITRRDHHFRVKTAIATIGIRGTDFWGGTNISDNALDVVMLEGKGVYVENAAGRVELDTAGTGTTVEPGKAPGAAKEWSQTKLQKAVATITP